MQPKRRSLCQLLFNLVPHFSGWRVVRLALLPTLGKQGARVHTDAAQLAAGAEHFYKTSIKEYDPEFGVEHTEALRHLADGYRMQRENGAKFVVSALTVCPVNWSYHLSIAGRRTVLRLLPF
jgi:hypothetical protein